MQDQFASWSHDYFEAREKFREAAQSAGFELRAHSIAAGKNLYVDEVYRGPKWPQTLLIVTSGVHGIEGFAGSAIQIESLPKLPQEKLPEGMGILYVHGLNPYGFAHYHRTDENNVDLNRNCIDRNADLPPSHPLTRMLRDLMLSKRNPPGLVKFGMFIARHGFQKAKQALTEGQYEFPDTLYYGGKEGPVESAVIWDNIVRSHCIASNPNIIHIDLHTGLGPFAKGEIMVSEDKTSSAYHFASKLWNDVTSIESETSSSSKLRGDINSVFNRHVSKDRAMISATLEFGTVNPIAVVSALAVDNWSRAFDQEGKLRERAKIMMLNAFNPPKPEWRIPVIQQGIDAIHRVFTGVNGLSLQ